MKEEYYEELYEVIGRDESYEEFKVRIRKQMEKEERERWESITGRPIMTPEEAYEDYRIGFKKAVEESYQKDGMKSKSAWIEFMEGPIGHDFCVLRHNMGDFERDFDNLHKHPVFIRLKEICTEVIEEVYGE